MEVESIRAVEDVARLQERMPSQRSPVLAHVLCRSVCVPVCVNVLIVKPCSVCSCCLHAVSGQRGSCHHVFH